MILVVFTSSRETCISVDTQERRCFLSSRSAPNDEQDPQFGNSTVTLLDVNRNDTFDVNMNTDVTW